MPRQLDHLESQVEALQQSLQQLRLKHSTLKLEQALLQAVCDTLHWIRAQSFDQLIASLGLSHDSLMQLRPTRQQRDQVINSTCVSSEERLLLQQLSCSSPYFAPTTPPLPLEPAAEFEVSLLHRGSSAQSCNSNSTWGANNMVLQHIQPQNSSSPHSTVHPAGLVHHSSSGSGNSSESPRSLLAPDPDDMLFQLRNLLRRPPLANAQALTLEQLLALYQMNVYELSLAHALLDNPFICAASKAGSTLDPTAAGQTAVKQQIDTKIQLQPVDALLAAVTKYFHVLMSLELQGRNSLVVAFQHTNILTGETHEHICQQIAQQLHWAVQKADLSKQQLHRIATGSNLRKRLLQELQQEQQKLRQQIAASCETAAAGPSSCAATVAGSGIPGGHMTAVAALAGHQQATAAQETTAAVAGLPTPGAAMTAAVDSVAGNGDAVHAAAAGLPMPLKMVQQGGMRVAERQQLFDRLRLLQKKENMLRACFMCFTLGCLTPIQVSKLVLAMFPHPLDLSGVEYMAELLIQGKA